MNKIKRFGSKFWSKKVVWLNIAIVNSQAFLMTATISWPSSAIPKIKGLSDWSADNLGNVFLYGAVTGSLLCFFTLTFLSRKMTLISNEIILIVSWILLLFKSQLYLLYVGRFLAGVIGTSIALNLPVYEAECYHPKDRQISGGIMSLYTAVAFWIEFSVSPFISYESVVIVNLVPIIIFLIYFPYFGAESPFTLIKRSDEMEAQKVMQVYWSKDSVQSDIDQELEKIKYTIKTEREIGVIGAFKSIFTNKIYFKTTIIVLILMSFFTLTGFLQIAMNMESILIKAQVSQISPQTSSAVIGTVKLIGAILSTPTINYIGVKKTLLLALSLNALSMIMLGGYFFAKAYTDNLNLVFWIPIFSLSLYFMATLMGALMLPFLIRGELLPWHLRGPGGASTDLLSNIFSVAGNYMFIAFYENKIYLDFWIFACILILNILFVQYYVPETQDKTLHEIQDELK